VQGKYERKNSSCESEVMSVTIAGTCRGNYTLLQKQRVFVCSHIILKKGQTNSSHYRATKAVVASDLHSSPRIRTVVQL
jgi:hypothetical protein